MEQTNQDIMVHGVPNVVDAGRRLREEMDQFQDMFGEIMWVRMGQNRGFHQTNYAFVRYRNTNVHREVVEHFNRIGIDNTRIWMEINPRPTQPHHLLQDVPATPRVAHQLAEVERLREEIVSERAIEQQLQNQQLHQQLQQQLQENQRLRDQLAESRRENTSLQTELTTTRNLVNELLNAPQNVRTQIEFIQPPRSPSPRARDPLRAWRPYWQREAQNNSRPRLEPPPTTRVHGITGGPCPICLEQFENCNSVVEMRCGHRACESCMHQNILYQNENCPLCRQSLGPTPYRRVTE